MTLKIGMRFHIKDTDMIVEVESIDSSQGTVFVEIASQSAGIWYENWVLSHTITGFAQGIYKQTA